MPRLQFKSFDSPDEHRPLPRGGADIVSLGDTTVGRARWEAGWRWSIDHKPLFGTASCLHHHLGYSVSGVLRVVMDDGQTLDIPPGSVYEIPPGHDAMVIGDEAWETVEWMSARTVGLLPEEADERVFLTVLITDIVDSTRVLKEAGDTVWRDRLSRHNVRLRETLNTFRGREVATTGDGLVAVFDSPTRAVRAGAAMTRLARDMGLPIRVGVHTGEVEYVGADVRGLAVHLAARVMAAAGPDEVFVSSTTRDLLEGSGLELEDAGSREFKGLSGPRSVHRLVQPPS
jgi:class 3 adenylate cyclase